MSRSYVRGLTTRRGTRVVAPLALMALVGALAPWGSGPAGAAPGAPATGVAADMELEEIQAALDEALPDGGVTPIWKQDPSSSEPGQTEPTGIPSTGPVALMLELETESTGRAYEEAAPQGQAAATSAAEGQLDTVEDMQVEVENDLPEAAPEASVLYRTHSVMPGVAVLADRENIEEIEAIDGVQAVHPIVPKSVSNVATLPLIRAPQAWETLGETGEGLSIGVIDTGVDYTHAGFGGPGTVAAFEEAFAHSTEPTDMIGPDHKVVGGFDFVGDDYNANPAAPDFQPVPHPDPNPLDCQGHGSHVSGTATGLGVTADGETYTGPYDSTTPFDTMRIGPGIAPGADLYGLRVFGCTGSSSVVGQAVDWAVDPNGDGDPSDHLDIINLSLGSDFGYPTDADSIAINRAAQLGVVPVIASGNNGDLYDTGGSPGNAVRSVAVAASADGFSIVDGLEVAAPASIAGNYPGELSVAYDYAALPGVTNAPVSTPLSPANADGCDPLSPEDAAIVAGKVAWLEWTANDNVRRCGSAQRSGNVKAAGAIGFVFANDQNFFTAGITGDPDIPGMLINKAAGDTIRPLLADGVNVTITGALRATQRLSTPETVDTLASFSSRGVRGEGNVKPDVAAPGLNTFSVGSGTGNQGANSSGTSMATPVVAGLATLVKSRHPDWTVEQVKANIMNTATADVFSGLGQTGPTYAPNRVGAGRVNAEAALTNQVLAYVGDGSGAVSVSFGVVEVTTSTMELSKTVTLENTSPDRAATLRLGYQPLTEVPGVEYEVSPSFVSLLPHQTADVTVTLRVTDRDAMVKTLDPTMARTQLGLPRQFLADASGNVIVTTVDPARPDLRVPVYSAPRPASNMTQFGQVNLDESGNGQITLLGRGVSNGVGDNQIVSLVSGYELLAQSGQLPDCTGTTVEGCVLFSDERSVDVKNVGAASNAGTIGLDGGVAYFAVNTWANWRAPVFPNEIDILIDTNGDDVTDAILFTARITGTDLFFSALVDPQGNPLPADPDDPNSGQALIPLNGFLGNTDTNLFDSDTMIIPVQTSALPGVTEEDSRINFAVATFDFYHNQPLDLVGATPEQLHGLTFDPQQPGIMVGDPTFSFQFFEDTSGSVLNVRRNAAAYEQDQAQGIMIVHQHNPSGRRSEIVSVQPAASPQ